jgi:hypothetical protein
VRPALFVPNSSRASGKPMAIELSKVRKLIVAAIALLSMGGAATARTTPEASTMNIFLVHGAFVDGSGWRAAI